MLFAKDVRNAVEEYYPSIKDSDLTSIKIGKAMKRLNYENKPGYLHAYYQVVKKKTA